MKDIYNEDNQTCPTNMIWKLAYMDSKYIIHLGYEVCVFCSLCSYEPPPVSDLLNKSFTKFH